MPCQDETGSKLGSRGDSAVSKGTTDSGVVMENKAIPELPGAMPRKLPPLTSERVGESVADRMTQEGGCVQQVRPNEEKIPCTHLKCFYFTVARITAA